MLVRMFTCENCKGEFVAGWTDEDAAAEHLEVFGEPQPEDAAVVCDDCYDTIVKWAKEKGLIK